MVAAAPKNAAGVAARKTPRVAAEGGRVSFVAAAAALGCVSTGDTSFVFGFGDTFLMVLTRVVVLRFPRNEIGDVPRDFRGFTWW